jgi:hypothetical protein
MPKWGSNQLSIKAPKGVREEEIIKGYEHTKGHHVLIKPKEIDELRLEAKHTIDMATCVLFALCLNYDAGGEVKDVKRQGPDLNPICFQAAKV